MICRLSLSTLVAGLAAAPLLTAAAASPVQYRPIIVEAMPPAYLPATPPTSPQQASRFQAAPVPNRDVDLPTERATLDPKLTATLYNRRDQYRGDAIAPNSSAQIDQERRVRPGAGLALKIPQ